MQQMHRRCISSKSSQATDNSSITTDVWNNRKVWTWTPMTQFYGLTISLWSLNTENLKTQPILYQKTLACYREYTPSCKGRWHMQLGQHFRFLKRLPGWQCITSQPAQAQFFFSTSESLLSSQVPQPTFSWKWVTFKYMPVGEPDYYLDY